MSPLIPDNLKLAKTSTADFRETSMILQFGLQILLPIILLVSLWRGKLSSLAEWLLNVLAVSAALLFLFLTARWDFTSYYLRFLLVVLIVPAAYLSYRRVGRLPADARKTRPS
jgi:hypothetical protein